MIPLASLSIAFPFRGLFAIAQHGCPTECARADGDEFPVGEIDADPNHEERGDEHRESVDIQRLGHQVTPLGQSTSTMLSASLRAAEACSVV